MAFEVISDAWLNTARPLPGRMQPKAHCFDAARPASHSYNFFNFSFHYTTWTSRFEGYVQDSFTTAVPTIFYFSFPIIALDDTMVSSDPCFPFAIW